MLEATWIPGRRSVRILAMVDATFARGGTVHVRAAGGSMAPTIPDGAMVAVGGVEGARLRVGDVLLCRVGGRGPVLHRLVGPDRDGSLWIRGDSPAAQPDRLARAAVLGRAIGVVEAGRIRPIDGLLARLGAMARRAAFRLYGRWWPRFDRRRPPLRTPASLPLTADPAGHPPHDRQIAGLVEPRR